MSVTTGQTDSPIRQQGEPPCYEIAIRTWTTDRDTAFDLAVEISEYLADNDQVDATATTIGVEGGGVDTQERIFTEMVGVAPEGRAAVA